MHEAKLAYPIGVEIEDQGFGPWFLVYDGTEGFQPLTYAIRTSNACSAEDIWAEQPRNIRAAHFASRADLVVLPLKRSTVWRNADTGRFVSKSTYLPEEIRAS